MEYRREIDGLRALAVIPVIFFHAGFQAFSGGYVGVDVFFVISGYLITSIILAEKEAGTFTLVGFYERRVRRILPALFFVMLVCLPLAWMWLLPNEMRRFSASLVAVSTFSSNVLFYLTSGYFDGEIKPLLHTWSLAVEEQYYVLFPIFIMLAWSLGKRWMIALLSATALVSLAAAQWFSLLKPEFGFLLLPTRLWELVVGVLIAFYLADENNKTRSQFAGVLGVMLIAYSVLAFDRNTPFPGVYALLPTIGTGLVILYATPETWIGRFLGSKILVGLGLISYSAYLWHQPLFAFAKHRSLFEPDIGVVLALIVLTFLLAYVSWRAVEKPFRDRNRFTRSQVFGYGAAFSCLFIALGLAGHFSDGFESRLPADALSAHIVREHEKQITEAGCKLHADGFHVRECIQGDKSVLPKVALVGDSHAQAITHELSEAFARNRLSFIPYVKPACPQFINMPLSPRIREALECNLYQKEIEKEILRTPVETYIFVSRKDNPLAEPTEQNFSAFEAHLRSIVALLNMGKKVILVYPIPVYKVYVSDYMAKNLWFYGGQHEMIVEGKQAFEKRVRYFTDRYDAIGVQPNLARVYTTEVLCNSAERGQCFTQMNGVPLYFDESHLSNTGARLLVEKIMQESVR
ncbi:MAG: acyltransferase family protein [Betaproteobacteria bacterium]